MSRNYLDVRSRGFRVRTHSKDFCRRHGRGRRRSEPSGREVMAMLAERTTFSTRPSRGLLTWPSKSVKLPAKITLSVLPRTAVSFSARFHPPFFNIPLKPLENCMHPLYAGEYSG